MLNAAALIMLVSISGTTDAIFHDGYDGSTCPNGRIIHSSITWGPGGGTLSNVDLTEFANIWGRVGASDLPESWPGRTGASPIINSFVREGYVAAHFHTPAAPVLTQNGFFKYVSYSSGPNITFSISPQCADFYPVQSSCLASNISASDTGLVYWRYSTGGNFYCQLEPDTDYFVNIELTDPQAAGPNCTDATCLVHTLNYFGQ